MLAGCLALPGCHVLFTTLYLHMRCLAAMAACQCLAARDCLAGEQWLAWLASNGMA